MKRVIWKFPLALIDIQKIMVPEGAKLLTVQQQNDTLCLWAMCNPEARKTPRCINIYGTGHQLPSQPGDYISTVQCSNGLVWHVFDQG